MCAQKKQNTNLALKFLNDECIDYISEAIYNLLYNENVKNSMKKRQKNKIIKTIKPNLQNFEVIARKHLPITKIKNKIIQSGIRNWSCFSIFITYNIIITI